ncbi:MAG: hypothetical protein JXQ65_04060 [Candidatus Marinimicrobia bacterium]|nr:hypothetical protein [Candidatus Neomarinimicrobiota bacterium]
MQKKSMVLFILFITFRFNFAQTDSIAVSDTLQRIMIYEEAYRTASHDRQIKEDEKAILKTLRRSLLLSKFDVKEIEYQVSLAGEKMLDQSGRWPLVLQNIGWGAGLYGWGIPYMLNVQDEKWYAASTLLSFSASFYLTYRYTRTMDIPHPRAQMMRLGSGIGFHYGYSLGKIAGLDFDFEEGDRSFLGLMMVSVPAGIWIGDQLYQRWQPTNGQSWAITLASAMGALATSSLYNTFNERPDEPWCDSYQYDENLGEWIWYDCGSDPEYQKKRKNYKDDLKTWERAEGFLYLAAYPLSLYAGNKIFGHQEYSFGDATILYQGWAVGMLYSLMLMDLLQIEEEKIYSVGAIMGGVGSVYLYHKKILGGFDFSLGESILLATGTISGIAFGGAIGIITEAEFEFAEASMILGGIAGTWITRKILNPDKDGMAFGKIQDFKLSVTPDIQYCPTSSVSSIIPGINIQLNF